MTYSLNYSCNTLSIESIDNTWGFHLPAEGAMARMSSLDKMSYAQLTALRTQVDGMMVEKQAAERAALRQKLSDMAKEHGLSLEEVLGKRRKGKGSVAIKYR